VSAPPDREETVRIAAAVQTVAAARIEAVLHAGGQALPGAAAHLTDPLAEVPQEIATARERAERTLPPDWWMGGSDCRSHV
jgi:hypothetical protein